MEEWKVIPEFPHYSVSSEGRVRNDGSDRILTLLVNHFGVVHVGLMGDRGVQERRSVPLLVAKAFVEKPPNVSRRAFDTPICLDGNRLNVTASNLTWRPRWFAIKYNQQFRHRAPNTIDRPIRDKKTGVVSPNSFECAKWYGLLEQDLVMSILNKTYVWPTYQQFEFA